MPLGEILTAFPEAQRKDPDFTQCVPSVLVGPQPSKAAFGGGQQWEEVRWKRRKCIQWHLHKVCNIVI